MTKNLLEQPDNCRVSNRSVGDGLYSHSNIPRIQQQTPGGGTGIQANDDHRIPEGDEEEYAPLIQSHKRTPSNSRINAATTSTKLPTSRSLPNILAGEQLNGECSSACWGSQQQMHDAGRGTSLNDSPGSDQANDVVLESHKETASTKRYNVKTVHRQPAIRSTPLRPKLSGDSSQQGIPIEKNQNG